MFTPKLCCTRHKTAPLTFLFFITVCFFSLLFLFLLILLLLFLSFPPSTAAISDSPRCFPPWLAREALRPEQPPTHPPTSTSPLSSFLPSCCFSLASAAVRCAERRRPLPVWRANSRPCDCAQESEDCITACGERPQEWAEKKGRVGGGEGWGEE